VAVDRLVGLALSKQWDRVEFRDERRGMGELMAQYIELVRRKSGFGTLGLTTVWTWADGPEVGPMRT
jgi:hypothetical protein